MIVDAAIGHADPTAHFTSEVLPHLVAARTDRAAALIAFGVDGSLLPAHQLHHAALAPLKMIGIELLTTAAWSEELVRQSPSVPAGR